MREEKGRGAAWEIKGEIHAKGDVLSIVWEMILGLGDKERYGDGR